MTGVLDRVLNAAQLIMDLPTVGRRLRELSAGGGETPPVVNRTDGFREFWGELEPGS